MRRWTILILVGIALFLIPIVGRTLWFYRGTYRPPDEVPVPSFSEITIPALPVQGGETTSTEPEPLDSTTTNVILIDTAHSNRFDVSELETLTRQLSARGASVQLLDSNASLDQLGLEGRLKFVSAYIVISPFEPFAASEVEAIRQFVERDGRLLVILDPTRSSSDAELFGFSDFSDGADITIANQLLEPHDLSFSDDYLYDLVENEGNFRNVFFEIFNESPLTESLDTVTMYAARSVFTEAGTPLISGGETVFSSLTDLGGGHSVAAASPNMRALALGDFTFIQPPYDGVTDNRQLIDNLAEFLITGEREPALEDLPFVFNGPVAVIQSGDFSLQAETLAAFEAIQNTLNAMGSELIFEAGPDLDVDHPGQNGDRLVLGLFDPDPDLDDYLAPLEITYPSDDPDGLLHVPGFGALNPAGIGVVGVVREDGLTNLALLAEDEEKLISLLESMSFDLLEGCLLNGAYGLCKVGEGEGFGSTDEFEFDLDFEETFSD
jgi:hypothetical protein